jgi:hypothetical protein
MKWSYKAIWYPQPQEATDPLIKDMDQVGANGWEAFAVAPHSSGWWIFFKQPQDT